MSEVQRYEPVTEFGVAVMDESPTGRFVSHEDYAALQQKLDAVTAENVALKESRQRLGKFIIEEIKADYPLNMELETPATDAIINALRAEYIADAFAAVIEKCRTDDHIDERLWNHGVLRVQHHMDEYTAQLRNGEHVGEDEV